VRLIKFAQNIEGYFYWFQKEYSRARHYSYVPGDECLEDSSKHQREGAEQHLLKNQRIAEQNSSEIAGGQSGEYR
jgi:hypothetical protein